MQIWIIVHFQSKKENSSQKVDESKKTSDKPEPKIEPEEPRRRGGSRAAAQNARNMLKEPNLGSKLRQGDPVAKSVYDDFVPGVKVKKSAVNKKNSQNEGNGSQTEETSKNTGNESQTRKLPKNKEDTKKVSPTEVRNNNNKPLKKGEISQILNEDSPKKQLKRKIVEDESPKERTLEAAIVHSGVFSWEFVQSNNCFDSQTWDVCKYVPSKESECTFTLADTRVFPNYQFPR